MSPLSSGVPAGPGPSQMSRSDNFLSSWRERLSALKNVPPILKIVWQSGPGVVTFGSVDRVVAALLPVALTFVGTLIIGILYNYLKTHELISSRLWWLVFLEFGLAVVS